MEETNDQNGNSIIQNLLLKNLKNLKQQKIAATRHKPKKFNGHAATYTKKKNRGTPKVKRLMAKASKKANRHK